MQPLSSRLTRSPLPFDRQAYDEVRADHADLPPDLAEVLATIASCSPYLRDLMRREAAWLRPALFDAPERQVETLLSELGTVGLADLPVALRQAKRRVALLVGLCDLAGVWDLVAVTGALTALADRAVALSIRALVGDAIRRDALPGAGTDDAETGAGLVALAMGKMGGAELNYSSDIDLVCLFDDDRYGADAPTARAAFVRIVRRMAAMLSDVTDQGYVFRTDLRLRPDASVTPVCLSMQAALTYYEAEGRTWERAAYIKARPAGGDLAAGGRFLSALTPFVWRKHLDFAAIEDAHAMRLRIRDHRGLNRPLTVEGHDMKLGQGGIREIEFFTQTRQLIAGGRDARLRDRTTLGALSALAQQGWLPDGVARDLSTLYRAHREVEHRLQMVGDAQTHSLPITPEGVARIAAMMGQDEAGFRRDLLDRLARTDALTDGFFAATQPPASAAASSNTAAVADLSPESRALVDGWLAYPALRSDRARGIFRRLRPQLLARLTRARNPHEALLALDAFLRGLPAGVQVFSLFDANPALVDLVIDVVATAPALAAYLARNSGVFDAVIGGAFFAPWPGVPGLVADLSARVSGARDYEQALDALRRAMKEWHFRVGVHHLRGLIDGQEAGAQYAALASAVMAVVTPLVAAEMARKHGPAPGRGAVVLGMGSLGAGALTAGSDLDLIVVYDAAGIEMSSGPRPLATRAYFARFTQGLVTALQAPMAEGRLYEVDMRLRPSGRQGPVAASLDSFAQYHLHEAWGWEHLALTRARVVAGPDDLGAELEVLRRQIMATKGQVPTLPAEVAQMRARLFAAKPLQTVWEARNGPGRMMDIALFAQMLALQSGSGARGVVAQLQAASRAGRIATTEAETLQRAYRLFWQMQAATRLLGDDTANPETLGEGARAFLWREAGVAADAALTDRLSQAAALAAQIIDAALPLPAQAPPSGDAGQPLDA